MGEPEVHLALPATTPATAFISVVSGLFSFSGSSGCAFRSAGESLQVLEMLSGARLLLLYPLRSYSTPWSEDFR